MAACGGGSGPKTSNTSPVSNTVSSSSSTPSSSSMTSSSSSSFEDERKSFETSEYYSNWGLAKINASAAYARGATGEGTLIGIMDSGVDASHQELDSVNKFTSDSYFSYQTRFPNTEEKRHGTHVSGIAVGDKDGSGMHGVAFDAQLFFISIELSAPPEEYDPVTIDETVDFTEIDNAWSQLEDFFVQREVTVVNGSFGYQGNINDYEEENLRYAFPKTIEVLAQANKPDYDKTIFVWSAGNGGGYADEGVDFSSPEVFGGMAYLLPELQSHSVAVVSIDSTGEISSFSNLCGVAKDYCIAAPGRFIYSAYSQDSPINDDYASFSGTSMAAPHVTGAIALLADYFRGQLGNHEILQRLFVTANKSGIYSDSSIYGQGLLDLDAATSPVGNTSMIASNGLVNFSFTEDSTTLKNLLPVVGDGWFFALRDKEIAIFDELDAPFFRYLTWSFKENLPSIRWMSSYQSNAYKRVIETDEDVSEDTRLTLGLSVNNFGDHNYSKSLWPTDQRKLRYFSLKKELKEDSFYFIGHGLSPSIYFGQNYSNRHLRNKFIGSGDYENPYFNFVKDGSFIGGGLRLSDSSRVSGSLFKGFHVDKEIIEDSEINSSGLTLEYLLDLRKSLFSFQGGFLKENSSLLGSSFNGGYGSIDYSETFFSGFNTSLNLSKANLIAAFFIGKTEPNLKNLGLISDLGDFKSSSFSLGLHIDRYSNGRNSFGINISQPLRIDNGIASFLLPMGRNKSKEIVFKEIKENIRPSGRELNLQFFYEILLPNGNLFTRFGLTKDKGHIKRNNPEPFFEITLQIKLI